MKLNLGCSDRHQPGCINVDIVPPCDQIADLSAAWPWETSSIDFVYAHDIFEHLPSKIHTMNELWRVLKAGGRAEIIVPSACRGAGAFQDPTHSSLWVANDFEYYEIGNFARERFRGKNGITADFRILSLTQEKYQGKWDEVWKITILLEAVK
jgi:predicted SAM-dependent methyltransferase